MSNETLSGLSRSVIVSDYSETKDLETKDSEANNDTSNTNVADYWVSGLSPSANLQRLKATHAGLVMNWNDSVNFLIQAISLKNTKEVQYHLKKMNKKWEKVANLQKILIQLIPEQYSRFLQEESRVFENNRDVTYWYREQAMEFLKKAAPELPKSKASFNKYD